MIYCVEDDSSIRDLILYTLLSVKMNAKGFSNSEELFAALDHEIPNLILLDIMLPGEDGFSILKRLKNNQIYKSIPVIMSTAKGTEFDKVQFLDAGADDYLVKPFGMKEMISRINAVLRRYNNKKDNHIFYKNIVIDDNARNVLVDDNTINLTLKEYDLLLFLIQNLGNALSREEILTEVWGSNFVGESRTIDVHIASLRNKLGDVGNKIKTIHGIGYCLEK